MPDITMCAAVTCPSAKECYRNPASGTKPSDWRQSWSAFTYHVYEGVCSCHHYWPVDRHAAGIEVREIAADRRRA